MLHEYQEPENQPLPVLQQTSEPQTTDAPAHAPTPIPIETEERNPDSAHVLYSLEVDAPTATTTFRPTALSKAVLKDFQTVKIVRRTWNVLLSMICIYVYFFRTLIERSRHNTFQVPTQIFLSALGIIFCGFVALVLCVHSIGMRAGKRLSRLDDPRIVAPLLEVYANYNTLSYLEKALIRLFPQMTPIDARHLSLQNKQQIYRVIGRNVRRLYFSPRTRERHIQLSVAALKALERIGTREFAPLVKSVISTTNEIRIREAAERCLPYLEMRPEESEASLSLLRSSSASDVNETADPTLLRPATGSGQSADELLRPG